MWKHCFNDTSWESSWAQITSFSDMMRLCALLWVMETLPLTLQTSREESTFGHDVDGFQKVLTCSLFMVWESWSAFTLQATSSCAVEAATCLAEEMSFSSLACPCTAELAASHRLLVAAATIRAWWFQRGIRTRTALHNVGMWRSKRDTYSGDEPLRPLPIIHGVGWNSSHLKIFIQTTVSEALRVDLSSKMQIV